MACLYPVHELERCSTAHSLGQALSDGGDGFILLCRYAMYNTSQ